MKEALNLLLDFFILLTALPAGYFLAWLCKDELVLGRKWFYVIFYSLAALFVVAFVYFINLSAILSLAYMMIVTIVSLRLGKDRKFLKP